MFTFDPQSGGGVIQAALIPSSGPYSEFITGSKQTAHLLDVASTTGDPLVALWTLAALTGARNSELLGLEWRGVDIDVGRLTIRPNAVRDVKTPRSRRTLDLAEDALAALVAHQDRQTFQRSALGEAYTDLGLVFASEIGTLLDHDNVTKRWKKALTGCGRTPV